MKPSPVRILATAPPNKPRHLHPPLLDFGYSGEAAPTPATIYGADLLLWQVFSPETATKVGGGTLANGDGIAAVDGLAGMIGATMVVGEEPRYDVVGGVGYANPLSAGVRWGILDSTLTLPAGDWTIWVASQYAEANNSWFGSGAGIARIGTGFLHSAAALFIISDGVLSPTGVYDPPPAGTVGVTRLRRSGTNILILPSVGSEATVDATGLGAIALTRVFNNMAGQGCGELVREFVVIDRAPTADENAATYTYMNAGLGVP